MHVDLSLCSYKWDSELVIIDSGCGLLQQLYQLGLFSLHEFCKGMGGSDLLLCRLSLVW